jgi:hypothetical protein
MKRKIPKLKPGSMGYPGPSIEHAVLNVDPTGFSVWALAAQFSDPIDPSKMSLIRVFRTKTHEVTGSKWVEFQFAPSHLLLNCSPVYLIPELKEARIICEWSDFLRLTRWRKQLIERSPSEQALIARVDPVMGLSVGCQFALRAVDHPIRKGAQ